MIQKLTVHKDTSFQGHASKVYTPRSLMPFIYCQDGSCIPVVYGIVKTEGTIIYNAPSGTSIGLSVWVIISCGKIALIAVYKNTDQELRSNADDPLNPEYILEYFNNGMGNYAPSVEVAAAARLNNGVDPGIAHIFFGHDNYGDCKLVANTDKKMPDLRFIVQRDSLQSGIINTPDIYIDTVEMPSGQTWVGTIGYLGRWTIQNGYHYPQFIDSLGRIRLVGMGHGIDWQITPPQVNEPTLVDVPQLGEVWKPNTSYSTFIPKSSGSLVIGADNHVYQCKQAPGGGLETHTSDYSNQPNIGENWDRYWEYYGHDHPFYEYVGPTQYYRIRQGDIVLGAGNGLPYRAIRDADYTAAEISDWLPDSTTSVLWLDLWCPANGKPWVFNDNYIEGDEVTGTDGILYTCIKAHAAAEANRPILKINSPSPGVYELVPSDWSLYWESSVTNDFIGNNPAAIAYDILTNTFYGCGIPVNQIDLDTFNVAADYYAGKKYGLNIKITDISEARKTLTSLFDWCDLILTIGTNGLIQCKVFDPDAESIGTVRDEDFSNFSVSRPTWRDLPNEFEATYTEPTRAYEPASIELKNESAIAMAGNIIKKKSVDLSAFVNRLIAFDRLNEIMKRETFPRDSVSCEVSSEWSFARPGDLIRAIKTEYAIDSYFRIISVSTGKIDELNISLEMVEAAEVLFKHWTEPVSDVGRRRLMSPLGSPFTQGKD